MTTLLELQNITIQFGGLMAVDHVNLKVKKGWISALIGPNGAGKSTIFNIITGLYKPSSGNIWFAENDITRYKAYKVTTLGIARTFQNIRLFKNLSVLDNTRIGRHCRGRAGLLGAILRFPGINKEEREIEEKACEALRTVDLLDKKDELAKNLPYGEQRRLEIARALAADPALLLLDEPAAGMNPQEKGALMQMVENLSKIYGSGTTQVKALDGVSFSVKRGEFVAIVGASGSGKSTLLHMIGGVDRPTAGKVLIEDTDIYKLDKTNLAIFRRRQVGLIYQFYNLLPILNVEENITLPLLLDGQKADQKFLKEVLETLNLADRAGHLPNELSGGEQQRVSIGRALINRPALVLADEPTGNLDSKNSQEIVDMLKLSNKRYHQTLLMVTHNHNIALMADRMITISDGRIVKDEVIRR